MLPDQPANELHQLALQKLTAVLGAERARAVLGEALGGLGISQIETPHELLRLSDALVGRGGFIGAVGAMLGVTAVLRGAGQRPS